MGAFVTCRFQARSCSMIGCHCGARLKSREFLAGQRTCGRHTGGNQKLPSSNKRFNYTHDFLLLYILFLFQAKTDH
jgi:hypothetical protein